MNQSYIRWVRVFIWCGVIFWVPSQPQLPGPEDAVLNFLVKKTGHLFVYALLYVFVLQAMGHSTLHARFKAALFCLLFAISDEWHQSFVPGRTAVLRDVGIDAIGCLVGDVVITRLRRNAKQ